MHYSGPENARPARRNDNAAALIAYVLHLVGAVTGITSIIGLVINYIKRHDGSAVADSHHSWMIRSFWWALLWWVIGALTWVFIIGIAIVLAAWLWYLYRHLRGLLYLLDDRPMTA
jgi:uncharacterized membrane protein